tara:strand:+ start:206 stop:598 length:393 start_codon:yes stop_codon:yes gene_type:complete
MTTCDGSCSTSNAVKAQYGWANGLVRHLNEKHTEKDSWVLKTVSDNLKWDYVKKFGVKIEYIKKSEIRPYTNKKGYTSNAHFSGDTYIGSVKKEGKKPINCKYYEVPYQPMWSIINGKFQRKISKTKTKN